MDSSSGGSFAWTDASNDSTDDSNMAETNRNQSGEESESGKTYKKRLRKYLFSVRGDDEASEQSEGNTQRKQRQQQSGTSSIHSEKNKQVKAEPESDADRPKKKKKCLGLKQDRMDNIYDESFLNSKVKSEQSFAVPSPVKAKRHKKKSVSDANKTICNGDVDEPRVSSLSEPKGVSPSHITIEDSFTLGSGKDKERDDNKYHIVKSKKIKKKWKEKSVGPEGDSMLNDAEEKRLKTRKSTATEIQFVSADQLSDRSAAHALQDNTSTTEESRPCEQTVFSDNGTQNHYSVNSERVDLESFFSKRKSRMSERIQFEDENDSDVQIKKNIPNTAVKPAEGNRLASFIESSICLRPVQVKLSSSLILKDDDDVWLIRCPKDVRLEAFQDQKWVLDSKCKIKLDGLTYEGDIGNTESNMTILCSALGKRVIKNVKVNGCLKLRRRLPKGHIRDENIMVNNQTNFIPLPDTKCRHPLFGLSYKKDIKLGSRAAAARNNKRETERLARRRAAVESSSPEELVPATITITGRKRKRTSSKAGEHVPTTQHKRVKRDLQPADVWDSEKAIEENLFNF